MSALDITCRDLAAALARIALPRGVRAAVRARAEEVADDLRTGGAAVGIDPAGDDAFVVSARRGAEGAR